MNNDKYYNNGGMIMELLAGEFLTYLLKFIALGVIAVAGVLCGTKYKKNKITKEAEAETSATEV